jgi:hypothetical protein
MLRQNATEDGSHYAHYGKGRPYGTVPDGSLVQRYYGGEECESAGKNP